MPHSVTRPPRSNTARWARVTLASLLSHTLWDDATDKIIARSQRTGGVSTSPNVTVGHHWRLHPSSAFLSSRNVWAVESWLQAVSSSYHAKPKSHKYSRVQLKGGRETGGAFGQRLTCFTACVGVRNINTFLWRISLTVTVVPLPPWVTAAGAGQVTIDKEVYSQQPGWTGMSSLALWGGWGKVTFFFGIRKWRREPAVPEILLCSHLHPRREFFHLCQRRDNPLTWLIPMASYMSRRCRCREKKDILASDLYGASQQEVFFCGQ